MTQPPALGVLATARSVTVRLRVVGGRVMACWVAMSAAHRKRVAWVCCAAVVVGVVLVGCAPRSFVTTAPDHDAPASSTVLPGAVGAVDSQGRLLVAPSQRLLFAVVDLERRGSLGAFEQHVAGVPDALALALARSGEVAATLRGRGDEILVWEPRARELRGRVRTEGGERVVGFAFTEDDRALMVATRRGIERRAFDGRLLRSWSIPGTRAFAAVPGADDRWIVAVELERSEGLELLDEQRARTRRIRIPGTRGVEGLRVSPDGRWLAVGAWGPGAADHLQVWDIAGRRRVAVSAAGRLVNAIAFSGDSRMLVVSLGMRCDGDQATRLVVWDLEQTRVVLDVPLGPASSLRVDGGEVLAVVGGDVVAVDLGSGRTREVFKTPCEPPCGLVICA